MAELSGLLAHELNHPLVLIAGAAGVLALDDLEDAERREALQIIERSVAHARQLVARLRMTADGNGDLGPTQRVDLVELVEGIVGDLSRTVLADHATAVEADGSVEWTLDPVGVRQILTNLLSNAAAYSNEGTHITVTVEADDTTATVTVCDRGHGVAPGDAERIFEPWHRGDDRTQGLGLGLYLSRRIARAHGGDLRVEPAPQQGSNFVLELPANPAS